ncbi:hypothetical protein ACIGEP_16380 [Microbacterium sp. NPDC077663]|uniref:hypothetical protein n=1 Tax=Microbacterium sp. NPDC077663 TaxID=3364189 RepID=UPI0037CB0D17
MDRSIALRSRRTRTVVAVATAGVLALGAVAAATPASAVQTSVTGAVFEWGINAEANAAAFAPGTYNLLSAGIVTATSASDRVTATNWKQTEGDVDILKRQADGSFADATFAGLSTDANGTRLSTGAGNNSGHVVRIGGGTGTVDPAAGTAEIQWQGTFTSAFYSGMTRSWITDPHLSVAADGTGTITATLGGYGTSMDDPDQFEQLAPVDDVVVATLTGVDVDADGFTVTPEYLGKTVNTGSGTPQVTGGANAGAFPQSFVDFQVLTGQGSYWYSSGGAADARKPASPLSVSYTAAAQPSVPTVTVSKTAGIARSGESITVTGTGFLPAGAATTGSRPPLQNQFVGAYVAFGKFAEAWQPSTGAAAATRSQRFDTKWALPAESHAAVGGSAGGAITLNADGSFTATLNVSTTAERDLLAGRYGIYTYAGSGATYAPFESFNPVAFAGAEDVVVEVPDQVEEPSGSFGWTFANASPADLGTAVQEGDTFVADGTLTNIIVTDTRTGGTTPYSWSISGQASDFTSAAGQSFSAGYLGWTPKVVQGGVSIAKGAEVTSSRLGGQGLSSSRVLAASSTAAAAVVGADLSLVLPGDIAAGAYTSKLTVTALQ